MNPESSISGYPGSIKILFLILITSFLISHSAYSQAVVDEPRYVRIIYLVPADSLIKPEYIVALENAVRHLQVWYYNALGMNRTFNLYDPVVEVYNTPHEALWYSTFPNGGDYFWNNVLEDGDAFTGRLASDHNNIWVYYIDANPACEGQCGGCGWDRKVVISANDLKGLAGYEIDTSCPDTWRIYSSGRYVGGLGHELGHAMKLGHPGTCDEDSPHCWDYDLMMYGYTTYPNAYFNEVDKLKLSNSPFIQEVDLSGIYYPTSCMDLLDSCNRSMQTYRSIFYGDSILLEGRYQKSGGIYYDTLNPDGICDTIVRTHLTMKTPPPLAKDVSICEGETALLRAEGEHIKWYGDQTFPAAELVDKRDDQVYGTMLIGDQVWMAENLNYYSSSGSWYYNKDSAAYAAYGRLYDWETAQNVCPEGWYVPDNNDWEELIRFLGGSEIAGGKIKEEGYDHWDPPNTGASNSSGFTALAAGKKDFEGGFYHLGYYSKFWSASEYNSDWGNTYELRSNSESIFADNADKRTAFGVRCIRELDTLPITGPTLISNYYLPGTYTYYVTQTIHHMESEADTVFLQIHELPAAPGLMDTSICEGDSLLVSQRYYTSTGTYFDTVQSMHGCDSVQITELEVHPLPEVFLGNDTLVSTRDTIVLDAGGGFSDYHWSDGSDEQTITLVSLSEGDHLISVRVKNANHCVGYDTIVIHAVLPSSTMEPPDPLEFKIFPNPALDFLILKSNRPDGTEFMISIMDASGKIVYEKRISKTQASMETFIELSGLNKGIYMLKISSKDYIRFKKVICTK